MLKLIEILGLTLTVLICCGDFLNAAPIPFEVPSNPVYYKRLYRIRPLKNRDIDVYEVKELYYVRRTTPKPKLQPLSDDELDQRIRCDFDPTLPECLKFTTSSTSTSTSTMATTTTKATTTPSPTTTSTVRTTIGTTIGTTTTDLPLLPELIEEREQSEEATTPPPEEEDYPLEPDDEKDDFEDDDDTNIDNEINEPLEPEEDYLNQGGSIGGVDPEI